jgi:septum formation protein
MKIILASASPRRATLLKQLNIDFEADPSTIDEITEPGQMPSNLVEVLSELKGRDVAERHKSSLVIAADTIVCYKDQILGKPADESEARSMLTMLSDNTHDVYSGVWIGLTNGSAIIEHSFSFSERTKVTFSSLSESEINFYIAGGSPMDKAGAYGIQDDFGALFVKSIEGDYYNVVGFPLNAFYRNLRNELPHIHETVFFGKHA